MLTKVASISLHRLVFIKEALCVLCEVRIVRVSVCIMWVNLSLRGGSAMAQSGSMVGRERWTGLSDGSSISQSVSFDEFWRHIHLDITLTRRTSGRSLTQNAALTDVG